MEGEQCWLKYIDIKGAFLPIYPTDRHVLGMWWNNALYIDSCLPFALRSCSHQIIQSIGYWNKMV